MAIADAEADLTRRFNGRLSPREQCVLSAARDWCEQDGASLYLVGGSVRDLLLNRAHLDIDLAVDGDAPALGRELGRIFAVEVVVHQHFGTASLKGQGWSVDLSRTRAERYSFAGSLPTVHPAPIELDLQRRDFTVHAIALTLVGESPGGLIDPLNGLDDLSQRTLRVIHDESFRDDPTRMLRLGRYAARLQFTIDGQTERLARRDAAHLGTVSPARITHELERTFAEPRPEDALAVLDALHVLRQVLPAFRLSGLVTEAFERLRNDGVGPPAMIDYLMAFAATQGRGAAEQILDRLQLRQHEIVALRACAPACQAMRRIDQHRGAVDPVEIVERFAMLPLDALRGAGAALGGAAAQAVRRYLALWREVRPALRGDDIEELGVPKGPPVGDVLKLLRNGTLRGELSGRDAEEGFVRDWLLTRAAGGGAT